MKKVFLIYAVLIACILIWYFVVGKERPIFEGSKNQALKVSKHSTAFNQSVENILNGYYKMTDEFISQDTGSIDKNASQLKTSLDSLKIDELKKDTAIFETAATVWDNAKTEIGGMITDPSLQAKRESLNLFSNELFTLLLAIHYDLSKIYWQECSSAFGEDTPGNWLSSSEKSNNPYGKKDCATVKNVINFMPADSSGKK